MEDGTAPSHGGSGDRRDEYRRRRTLSGALPSKIREGHGQPSPFGAMKPSSSPPSRPPSGPPSPSAPVLPAPPQGVSHGRSLSGTVLRGFNFLRGIGDDAQPTPAPDKEPPQSPWAPESRKSLDDDMPATSPTSPKAEGSMALALRPVKTRKRKGSLRKTALLGGKRVVAEGRERKNSLSAKSPLSKVPRQQTAQDPEPLTQFPAFGHAMQMNIVSTHPEQQPRSGPSTESSHGSHDSSTAPSRSDSESSEPAIVTAVPLTLAIGGTSQIQSGGSSSVRDLGSPLDIKSPTSQASYASTTDDDDVLTFDRPAGSHVDPNNVAMPKPLSSTDSSYFPSTSELSSLRHRASPKQPRSPLAHTISSSSLYSPSPPPSHDYTETEYWGWVILFVTWLTFTVGMGSCLEIWSWAWDVGEKPYAPRDLEDDPTLPIVGYYPALIVLTGVVAWVWITVAWVGMKYFRHAKIDM